MANKKVTKAAEAEVITNTEVVEQYDGGADAKLGDMSFAKPAVDSSPIKESPEHFLNGEVPGGFSRTYGQEITNSIITEPDGQTAQLVKAAEKVFKREDNFRYFLKFMDGLVFTIVTPIRLSNQDELSYEKVKGDFRSVILTAGNVAEQVERFAARVAKHLAYQKNR